MSKKTKFAIITATSLVILGLIAFASVMTALGWDFTKLSTVKYETSTYIINDEFSNISVLVNTADVVILPSESDEVKIVCYESENEKHSVNVENGTLTVKNVDNRKWYEHIGISFSTTKITVYLPAKQISSLQIKTTTGDIKIQNMSVEYLELSVSTGDTILSHITCKSLISKGNTGDANMNNVIASQKMSVIRSTGDIEFIECDADEIYFKTGTGDIEGSLLSGKDFNVRTGTGDIDVPKNVTGGKCEIETGTGDVEITLSKTSN